MVELDVVACARSVPAKPIRQRERLDSALLFDFDDPRRRGKYWCPRWCRQVETVMKIPIGRIFPCSLSRAKSAAWLGHILERSDDTRLLASWVWIRILQVHRTKACRP